MKLVRFDGGKTGLMVQLAAGLHVIHVIGSSGVLSPDDPVSQDSQRHPERQRKLGSVDRALGAGASWVATTGVADVSEFRPAELVVRRAEDVSLASFLGNPGGIVALDIVESSDAAQDPTGRDAMEGQFVALSAAATQVTSIIPFPDKIRSVQIFRPLQDL